MIVVCKYHCTQGISRVHRNVTADSYRNYAKMIALVENSTIGSKLPGGEIVVYSENMRQIQGAMQRMQLNMVENDNTNPATAGDQLITSSTGDDSLTSYILWDVIKALSVFDIAKSINIRDVLCANPVCMIVLSGSAPSGRV